MKYYVIGKRYCYAVTKTIKEAKGIAERLLERDEEQKLHVPSIYKGDDVEDVMWIYGSTYAPKHGAKPIYTGQYNRYTGSFAWMKEVES